MILLINEMIETAAAAIPNSVYMRATDNTANTDVSNVDLAGKTFVVFNNLPRIGYDSTVGLLARVPVQIRFLELADFGDNTDQGDDIRDRMITAAQALFNSVMKNSNQARIRYADEMTIDLADNVKLYDTILTGVILEFDIYINAKPGC